MTFLLCFTFSCAISALLYFTELKTSSIVNAYYFVYSWETECYLNDVTKWKMQCDFREGEHMCNIRAIKLSQFLNYKSPLHS